MPPLDIDTVLDWRGRTVVDRHGDKIGTFDEIYLDEADRPAWAAVTTGLFGMRQTFVPLSEARPAGDDIRVPFERDHVKDAPNVDPDAQLTNEEERVLYRHYGLASAGESPPEARAGEGSQERADAGGAAADDRDAGDESRAGDRVEQAASAGEDTDEDPSQRARAGGDEAPEMIRSEEEVSVGTRRRVTGRARLRKYVVTDHVKKVVPVQREEVRVEFEPGDEEEAAPDTARGEAAEEQRARTERA
jgi:stress response protein YsnF